MSIILLALQAPAPAHRLVGQVPNSLPSDATDHGTFEVFSAGVSIGTETFQIRVRPDQIEAQGNVYLQLKHQGKNIEVRSTSDMVFDTQLDPLFYTWVQRGTQTSQLAIDFRVHPVQARYRTVSGQDDLRAFDLQKNVIVLDDNVIHHYQLAVARYDPVKGGAQEFRAFIPQEASPGVITLKSLGSEPVAFNGERVPLRHFLLTTELAQIDLWLDNHGHLQLVSAPAAKYTAWRKK